MGPCKSCGMSWITTTKVTDPWRDEDIQPLALTEPEIDDLVAFLASLTSPQYRVRVPKTLSELMT
jgi:hypothetical protein